MAHDTDPTQLVAEVQQAITGFALASGSLVLGTLGELKAATDRLHLAARSLYLATQIAPEAELPLSHYDDMPVEASIPAAELSAMFAAPSEPIHAVLRLHARPVEDNGTYGAVANRLDGQRAVVTFDDRAEIDISTQLAYALEGLDAFGNDRPRLRGR